MIALTPTVSNDLAADIQHSMTDLQQRAVEFTDYVANPIQDWITTFQAASTNLSSLYTQFQQFPFAASQQIAANFLQYAVQYVQPYQAFGTGAVGYLLGTAATPGSADFIPEILIGLTDLAAGNFAAGIPALTSTIWGGLALDVFKPLEGIPTILNPITQNLANATDYLTTTGIANIAGYFADHFMGTVFTPLGVGVQNVYNSLVAGDPLGAVINAIDIPALVTNSVFNGTLNAKTGLYSTGLIADGSAGFLKYLITVTPQGLANKMVAPNAQNIMSGGSLEYALGYLGNVLATGFPTPQIAFDNLLNVIRTYAGIPSAAAAAAANGSEFAALAPAASNAMAGLSAGVLKAFDPAAVTNIAASLGPSLAAEVAGSLGANLAGSLATTLSVDLSKVALHILSAL
ncbi:hypothetical protein BST25_06845 [Mycobacterium heidelbergense]|uniref:Uncharacterized protein n=1 Tax=Mycobacterium heidelbergense TaxID=53376 RepID=A0A1X0DS45_MYCHE|nr:hypothetical protein [Mycobacterium heidelbergense]ORA75195.1 hypothetical protein BST25_06845 [Mycobacterium heidelbergense]